MQPPTVSQQLEDIQRGLDALLQLPTKQRAAQSDFELYLLARKRLLEAEIKTTPKEA